MAVVWVAAGVVLDAAGRALVVRKRGTTTFMQPGGKPEPGESGLEALVRELAEEVGLEADPGQLTALGRFGAQAANEVDDTIEADAFLFDVPVDPDDVTIGAEIEEVRWIASTELGGDVAPLSRIVLPLAWQRSGAATSFGQAADDYERGRPDYPTAALGRLLPADAVTVADIGAGTGKLAGVIAATGRTVIAVDPDVDMLAALSRRLPGMRTLRGTGEHIPLDDGSVDAVTFGQSWHWVDPVRACREVARVLRPGGTLGLVWNIRDESVPWVAALTRTMHGSAAETLITNGGPRIAAPFDGLEHHEVRWEIELTVDEIVAMAASRSYVITSPQVQRETILRGVRTLLTTHPQTAGKAKLVLPYATHTYVTYKRDDASSVAQ